MAPKVPPPPPPPYRVPQQRPTSSAQGRGADRMLVYGPVRPAAEGHQHASESRCRRLSTGRPGGKEAQCPCMSFRPQLPALALQPMFTTTPATPYVQRPPIPGGPPAPHPAGSPAYAPPPPLCPQPLHTPLAAHTGPLPANLPRILPAGTAVWAAPAPPRRPRRSRLCRPRTTATWSWPTYGATWRA